MIDIHALVLPGLAGGPRNLDDSLAILRTAADVGIQAVIATPRCNGRDVALEHVVDSCLRVLRKRGEDIGLDIQILRGFKVTLQPNLLDTPEALQSLSLNNSRYTLVECSPRLWPALLTHGMERIHHLGLRLILANAEFDPCVRADGEFAREIVKSGVLLHVNASSLLSRSDRASRSSARTLLQQGLVSFLSPSSYTPGHSSSRIHRAIDSAARIVGLEAVEAMVAGNPLAVVLDHDLAIGVPTQRRRFLRRSRPQSGDVGRWLINDEDEGVKLDSAKLDARSLRS